MKFDLDAFRKEMRKKFHPWINLQNLIFFSVITAFIIIIIWSESISQLFKPLRPVLSGITPTPTTLFGTPTPLPAEWLTSAEQTNGILIGGIIILLTILAGTAIILLRDRE